MISFFSRTEQPLPAVPPGMRIYAIGDIHGHRTLLDDLLRRIGDDLHGFKARSEIVFLGDYIDRGPESAAVIDRLIEGPGPADDWVFLKGNHDHFLAHLVSGEDWKPRHYWTWIDNGGDEALKSWGLPRELIQGEPSEAVESLREALPEAHRRFFERLRPYHRAGDYLFVHAGVRPDVPLEEQDERDLLWIREEFLNHRGDFGAHVVHGHTISRDVDERKNRTGIDTGAFATGRLTALVLEGTERRYLAT